MKQFNQNPLQYTIQCGDECLVAPLSLFHPELLGITGRKKAQAKIQKPSAVNPDPEDPFDAEYLRETGVSVVYERFKSKKSAKCTSRLLFIHTLSLL